MRIHALCLLVAVLTVLLSGCGPAKPETCPVSGTVTWNGQPLPDGYIQFDAEDGKGVPPDAGPIKDGKYQLPVKPGKKKVQITATREVGNKDPAMGMAPRQQYIPARYNLKTELKEVVKPGDKNEFRFDLTGEEAKPKP